MNSKLSFSRLFQKIVGEKYILFPERGSENYIIFPENQWNKRKVKTNVSITIISYMLSKSRKLVGSYQKGNSGQNFFLKKLHSTIVDINNETNMKTTKSAPSPPLFNVGRDAEYLVTHKIYQLHQHWIRGEGEYLLCFASWCCC